MTSKLKDRVSYKFALARLGASACLDAYAENNCVNGLGFKTLLRANYDVYVCEAVFKAMNHYVLHGTLDELLKTADIEKIIGTFYRMADGKYSYVRKNP